MMSDVVMSYMLGHNFTNGRPPAVGEEHEVTSTDGHLSTHSGKSEVSSATPRRTDVDMGYEPEGSASPFPSYHRWTLSLHNMLEDSEGFNLFKCFLEETHEESVLNCLLALKGFKDFGLNSHSSGNSSAASSTTGSCASKNTVKETMDLQTDKRIKLAKLIYLRFMGKDAPKSISSIIKEPTKQYILQKIKEAKVLKKSKPLADCNLDDELFLQAQNEIELYLEQNLYEKFLKSDKFSQYAAQCESMSPKASSNVPSAAVQQSNLQPKEPPAAAKTFQVQSEGSANPHSSGYLPTLDEDQMWDPDQPRCPGEGVTRHSNPSLARTAMMNNKITNDRVQVSQQGKLSDASPYYTPSYWVPPASAVGSDQASKSSDATSDTLSMTDTSSVDGPSYPRSGPMPRRTMRKYAMKNPQNTLPECCGHVPRTSRTNNIPMLAQTNPPAFFEQLRIKLEKVIESRKKQRLLLFRTKAEQSRAAVARPPPVDEDSCEQILDSHIARTMDSPAERHPSAVLPGGPQRRPVPAQVDCRTHPLNAYQSDAKALARGRMLACRDPASLRKFRDDSNEVSVGVVPGLPQNEVPDVATPVNPVDKNQMINMWIQMGTPMHGRNKRPQKNKRLGSTAPGVETVPEEPLVVNVINNSGPSGASGRFPGHLRLAPLAQDHSMPPLDQPDARTRLEEVKRRLIEETENDYLVPDIGSLKVYDPRKSTPLSYPPTHAHPDIDAHSTDTESSTETATYANTTNVSAPSAAVPAPRPTETTVVYFPPKKDVPFKLHFGHAPLTLGQFKSRLPRKELACRFSFKQASPYALSTGIYFEYTKDDDVLPLFDGVVLAKLEYEK